ncbi:hypothetical protein [Brumimicrobium mesophilum]|uniref:hypothetical protein n=1 Tax=Brumimicrobium mesophilum TaxID=392717 RepID=UPI000D143B1B|nr:hypothetical protein [Brumimicrobium mesophilum]
MKLINIAYAIGAVLLLVGSYLKFNDNEYGATISLIGLAIGISAFVFQLTYLNSKVKKLEKEQS